MLWDHFILKKEEQFQKRIKLFALLMIIPLSLIVVRLGYLQLLQGERYQKLSSRNRVRLVPIKAQRGLIYDRQGELLVGNVPAFNISVIPASLPKNEESKKNVFQLLQRLLSIEPELLEEKLKKRRLRYYEPIRIKGNIDRRTAALIEEHKLDLPGVVVLTESRRHYKFDQMGFHALGYVGEISEHQLALSERYQAGDIIGQSGVEKVYDHYLKGRNGWFHIEVDALGKQMGILGKEEPWMGHNLVLTLDRQLQQQTEAILGNRRGVIIVQDVRNGEVLALTSYPTYNPNNFSAGISRQDWKKLRNNKEYPLTNRATQGLYPPGSILKIVSLMAALEEKVITSSQRFRCEGIFWISTWPYRCWKDSGHGLVNSRFSLVESCDIYYYKLALKLKVDKLGKWARAFGFGRPSGIDLPNERSGLVPTPQWKERTQNMPWFPGNTVMMAIGQGYILSTPMQLLSMTAAVANQGTIYRPHLLKQVTSQSGRVIHEMKTEVMHRVGGHKKNWQLLKSSMKDVVHHRKGTGKLARVKGIYIGGKTATAQNPHGEDHAAFSAFAPYDQPEVAVVVYLENAGGGGSQAAPLCRKVVEAYFGINTEETLEKE